MLNADAVDLAIRAGIALNANIARRSKFDRKQYFYADLPKGYQISQYDVPVCSSGYLEVDTPEGTKRWVGGRAGLCCVVQLRGGRLVGPCHRRLFGYASTHTRTWQGYKTRRGSAVSPCLLQWWCEGAASSVVGQA